MAIDGISGRRRRAGRPNPSPETKFSGANGDRKRKSIFLCSADHGQDWQPYTGNHTRLICTVLKVSIVHTVARVVQLVTSKPSDVGP